MLFLLDISALLCSVLCSLCTVYIRIVETWKHYTEHNGNIHIEIWPNNMNELVRKAAAKKAFSSFSHKILSKYLSVEGWLLKMLFYWLILKFFQDFDSNLIQTIFSKNHFRNTPISYPWREQKISSLNW